MPEPTPQRRRYQRFAADLPAVLYLESHVVEGRIVNVSRGGCLFHPAVGTQEAPHVKLSFQLNGDPAPINCKGEIVYTIRDRGTGIAFTEISEYNLDRMTQSFAADTAVAPAGV